MHPDIYQRKAGTGAIRLHGYEVLITLSTNL
jgi:hypothetical protein